MSKAKFTTDQLRELVVSLQEHLRASYETLRWLGDQNESLKLQLRTARALKNRKGRVK